jgi:uncharacterized membrane protein YjfL (UPF0719 family)
MKLRSAASLITILCATLLPPLRAAEAGGSAGWHAQTLPQAVVYMLLFAAIGILAAIAGYKVFDKCTPGDLHKEIVENKNVAAAIVAGAVILGISIIIAAAMIG